MKSSFKVCKAPEDVCIPEGSADVVSMSFDGDHVEAPADVLTGCTPKARSLTRWEAIKAECVAVFALCGFYAEFVRLLFG